MEAEYERDMERLNADLVRERSARISAETLAVERRAEVERLVSEVAAVRADLQRITEDRLRSLDALNVKLMTDRVEEKPPDMSQYRENEGLAKRAISRVRQLHRDMDIAVLTKLHPRFAGVAEHVNAGAQVAGAVMNEVQGEPAA
jgi:hypothetical protein